MARTKKIGWIPESADLFLELINGEFKLLNYSNEEDRERIHQIAGGECYYISTSGLTGCGFIYNDSELIRVGTYCVNCKGYSSQYRVPLGNGYYIMFPYKKYGKEMSETVKNFPVIMVGEETVIYCRFDDLSKVVRQVLSTPECDLKNILVDEWSNKYGLLQDVRHEPNILWQKFVSAEVEVKFFNLFDGRIPWPWNFVTERLQEFKVQQSQERLYQIFGYTFNQGKLVKTMKISENYYAVEALENDPCESVTEPISGWELAETNMLYKVRENEVFIVGWELAAYEKKVERITRFIPASEVAEFKNFVIRRLPYSKYVEFELTVPKLLFIMNKEEQFAKVRKGIATKVRKDVISAAKQFIANFNDKQILEAIPDELVITLEDSYESGNCQPGTKEFRDKYFPGKTEVTAGQLKVYADNWNVMRIFRYIAAREWTAGKVNLELPD